MSYCTRCGSTLIPDADGHCPACGAAPTEVAPTTGERIRRLRVDRDLRLRDLAGRLGIAPRELNDIEWDRREPTPELLAAITAELREPPNEGPAAADPTVHYVDDMGYCHVARVLASTPQGLMLEYSSHGRVVHTGGVWQQTGPFKTPGYWHQSVNCERLS
jgi:transcriptional regulator with XRE-family HTH domain